MVSKLTIGFLSMAFMMAIGGHASATSIAAPPQDQEFEQAWVTGRVNVRSGPGTDYRVVNRLKRGAFVNVGDCRRGWCYVDVYGGNGYILERVIGEGANPYSDPGPIE